MRWPYPPTPALGRGLPSNYVEGEKVFDERVKAKFPIGMSEAHLLEELRTQGFSVRSDPERADFKTATVTRGLIFRNLWSVRWRARADQIEDVWGVYGVIAPYTLMSAFHPLRPQTTHCGH